MTASSDDNNISKVSDSNQLKSRKQIIECPYSFSNDYHGNAIKENPEQNQKALKDIFEVQSLQSSIGKNPSEKFYFYSNINAQNEYSNQTLYDSSLKKDANPEQMQAEQLQEHMKIECFKEDEIVQIQQQNQKSRNPGLKENKTEIYDKALCSTNLTDTEKQFPFAFKNTKSSRNSKMSKQSFVNVTHTSPNQFLKLQEINQKQWQIQNLNSTLKNVNSFKNYEQQTQLTNAKTDATSQKLMDQTYDSPADIFDKRSSNLKKLKKASTFKEKKKQKQSQKVDLTFRDKDNTQVLRESDNQQFSILQYKTDYLKEIRKSENVLKLNQIKGILENGSESQSNSIYQKDSLNIQNVKKQDMSHLVIDKNHSQYFLDNNSRNRFQKNNMYNTCQSEIIGSKNLDSSLFPKDQNSQQISKVFVKQWKDDSNKENTPKIQKQLCDPLKYPQKQQKLEIIAEETSNHKNENLGCLPRTSLCLLQNIKAVGNYYDFNELYEEKFVQEKNSKELVQQDIGMCKQKDIDTQSVDSEKFNSSSGSHSVQSLKQAKLFQTARNFNKKVRINIDDTLQKPNKDNECLSEITENQEDLLNEMNNSCQNFKRKNNSSQMLLSFDQLIDYNKKFKLDQTGKQKSLFNFNYSSRAYDLNRNFSNVYLSDHGLLANQRSYQARNSLKNECAQIIQELAPRNQNLLTDIDQKINMNIKEIQPRVQRKSALKRKQKELQKILQSEYDQIDFINSENMNLNDQINETNIEKIEILNETKNLQQIYVDSILELRAWLEQSHSDQMSLEKEKDFCSTYVKRRKESMEFLMHDMKQILKLDEASLLNLQMSLLDVQKVSQVFKKKQNNLENNLQRHINSMSKKF